jgi:hypothetical protein
MEQFSKMSTKLKSDMSSGQERISTEISVSQEELRNKVSADMRAIRSSQAEFEEEMTDKVDKQLKGHRSCG